ncbi:AraC family transcriptional regulator [Cohnella silvisoli]|uniref:AraC family transcriptional regulator n=1 Tax=Cohnella silvisoli TaxID=2873699 RepID=A0ABV1KQ79_9BACL|nr:AraC family transcriptional regulator [Cohnella silvisoli]MCD9021059.1 AraC family transcriptional regulator [Cohnella silvisoli]
MTVYEGRHFFDDPQFPFYIDRYTIRRTENILPHAHDFVEFVYVESGCAVHEWSGKSHPLAPGDVFAIEPNTYHSYIGAEDKDTVVYNILFERRLLQNEMEALLRFPAFIDFFYLAPFLRNNASFVPYTPLKDYQRIQMDIHLRTIYEEYRERREGYQLIIKNRWIECMVLLSRFHGENREESPRPKELTKDDWIASIRSFVEQNCDRELSLTQLARTCGMSVSSFTSKFKQAAGLSLLDYKHAAQIRRACRLLEDRDHKIASIAYETGFNDVSFFNRIFRKHMGMTPKDYRKS